MLLNYHWEQEILKKQQAFTIQLAPPNHFSAKFPTSFLHKPKGCILQPESPLNDQGQLSKHSAPGVRVPKVRVEVFELPLVTLHCLKHQAHHLLTVSWAPLVCARGEEMENRGKTVKFIFTRKRSVMTKVNRRMTSKPLGFSRSLRNSSMALPSLRNKEGKRIRSKITNQIFYLF